MFSIEQFESTIYLVSSVFRTTCSPSNSLKIHFYLISLVFQMACSPSNSLEVPFYNCFPSISNGMFFIEQFESTKLPCFLSISNGMFFIEQFESTILPCFLSISNSMFFIEQFESIILPFSPAFQMACPSSNSLKICFSLFSHQYCKQHVLHRTVWKYLLLNFPQCSFRLFLAYSSLLI